MSNFLQQIAGAGGAGMAPGVSLGGNLQQFEDLQKALTATTYETNVANLTGGSALTVQSLDTALKATVQENDHFVLFNRLQSTNATNIVDEYIRQTNVGGWLGGSTNSQMGVVRAATGEYSREVGYVKFLMQLRQVSHVLNIGKNIVEAISAEEMNGAKALLTDAEYLLFHGDADASPTQFDGIFAAIDKAIAAGDSTADRIYDMNGAKLDSVEPFSEVNVAVSGYGSWGRISDVYLPISVQNDLNMGLDPAFRWSTQSGQEIKLGGQVTGVKLTNGVMMTNQDTFLHDEASPMVKPFEVTQAATATANAAFKPQTLAGVTASDASSRFTGTRIGNYYYAVEAIGPNGEGMSQVTKSAQVSVASGEKVTLTITASAANSETGYRIFRSKQNGTNTTADFRLMAVVKKAGGTTTYVDLNRDLPGTVKVPLLNLSTGADAIGWRQYQSMQKISLPFGVGGMAVHSWFQFLFGYLRVTKPKHHGYIKNILPKNATWRPFTAE